MLIIALIAAMVFYAVLYLIWDSAHTRLDSATAIMASLERMALMPQETIFVILRGMILITALYVVADLFVSSARKIGKRKKAEKMELGLKKPPVQP